MFACTAHLFTRTLTRSWTRGTDEYFCPILKVSWITVQRLAVERMRWAREWCFPRDTMGWKEGGKRGKTWERSFLRHSFLRLSTIFSCSLRLLDLKGTIELNDLFEPSSDNRCHHLTKQLERSWNIEVELAQIHNETLLVEKGKTGYITWSWQNGSER